MTSISSAEDLSHFKKAIEFLEESYPKITLALKSRKALDLDLRMFSCWTTSQCSICVATGASCP